MSSAPYLTCDKLLITVKQLEATGIDTKYWYILVNRYSNYSLSTLTLNCALLNNY